MTGTMGRGEEGAWRPGRLQVLVAAAALMVMPLLAVRGLGPEAWDAPGDFVFLAILLGGIALAFEVAVRVSTRGAYRAAAAVALIAGFLQIWINLAVGIIGSEDNPANWIYAGVIAVAGVGAVLAGLRASGMAAAMAATAVAQGLTFVVALAAGLGFTGPITVFFASLWLISASLFRKSARDRGRAHTAQGAS